MRKSNSPHKFDDYGNAFLKLLFCGLIVIAHLSCNDIAVDEGETPMDLDVQLSSRPGQAGSIEQFYEVNLDEGAQMVFTGSELAVSSIKVSKREWRSSQDSIRDLGYLWDVGDNTTPVYVVHTTIGDGTSVIDLKNEGITLAIPSNALPAQAIPSNALPAEQVSSKDLTLAAIPSNALPSSAIPSNLRLKMKSGPEALPVSAIPDVFSKLFSEVASVFTLAPEDFKNGVVYETVILPMMYARINGKDKVKLRCNQDETGDYYLNGLKIRCNLFGQLNSIDYELAIVTLPFEDYLLMKVNLEPIILLKETLDLNNPNHPPTNIGTFPNPLEIILNSSGTTFTISADDEDDDLLLAFIEGLPEGAYQSYNRVFIPAGTKPGTSTIRLTVIDNGNPAALLSMEFPLTIRGQNTGDANNNSDTTAGSAGSAGSISGNDSSVPIDGGTPAGSPDLSGQDQAQPGSLSKSLLYTEQYRNDWYTLDQGEYLIYFEGIERKITDVPSFALSEHLVANWEFYEFLKLEYNAGNDLDYLVLLVGDGAIFKDPDGDLLLRDGMDNLPVVNVTWDGARKYCATLLAELPSNTQWNYVMTKNREQLLPLDDKAVPTGGIGTWYEWLLDIDDPDFLTPCKDPSADCSYEETVNNRSGATNDRTIVGGNWSTRTSNPLFPQSQAKSPGDSIDRLGFRCSVPPSPMTRSTCFHATTTNGEYWPCRTHCTTAKGRNATMAQTGNLGCPKDLYCCAANQAKVDGGWCVTKFACQQ